MNNRDFIRRSPTTKRRHRFIIEQTPEGYGVTEYRERLYPGGWERLLFSGEYDSSAEARESINCRGWNGDTT
ncbi:hypothetical protein LCGC14_2141020 [marine sediment metagenome]|uniref:Uncharacterized protein n=1 Tax=marine sediment metagenome TaxID=412755 RepID=A0A0F9DYD8_9ZZZZ